MNIRAFVRGSNAVVVNKSHGVVHCIPIHAILSRPVVIIIIINIIISHALTLTLLFSFFASQRKKKNLNENARTCVSLFVCVCIYIFIYHIYTYISLFSRRSTCFSSRVIGAENLKTILSRSLSHNYQSSERAFLKELSLFFLIIFLSTYKISLQSSTRRPISLYFSLIRAEEPGSLS